MSIIYNEQTKVFQIDTKNTSYAFCITNLNFIEHLYYGKKVPNVDLRYLRNRQIYTFSATLNGEGREFAESTFLTEISSINSTDFREGSVAIENADKTVGNRFTYFRHEITDGREKIEGLPYSYADEQTQTLKLSLMDEEKLVLAELYFVVFPQEDVIARHIEITNLSDGEIRILRAQPINVDLPRYDFDYVEPIGMYLYEFGQIQRTPLKKGFQGAKSNTGSTSHHNNPLFMLCEHNATERTGDTYAFNLLYSGGFSNSVEVDRLGSTRIITGMNTDGFEWKLSSGEKFISPEGVMTFTDKGIGQASRNFHDHIREHIIEKKFAYKSRPIVVNSWEGSDMDVSEKSMLQLAKDAKEVGADTVVLDDGWFRSVCEEGLGDFCLDNKKFPNGLAYVSDKIHEMGLKFGIWFEPECCVEKSSAYEIGILRTRNAPALCREQNVRDFTNEQNIEDIYKKMTAILDGLNVEYLKWDYNRYIHEAGSQTCPYGELKHRQILGVYKLLQRIKDRYPDILIESCAGGGGRVDLGMLYYSPQIWLSDNTDPYARAYIQYGATYGYPTSSLSCHVTKGKGTSQRESTYKFRYLVSSMGAYGYELDLSKLTPQEKAELNEYSKAYQKYAQFVIDCDLYRLWDINDDRYSAYMQVNKDKTKALFTFIQINSKGFYENILLRLDGLDENKTYKEESSGEIYSGAALMCAGIRLESLFKIGAGGGFQLLFTEV